MDASQVLLVTEELRKWEERRRRLEEDLLRARARRRFLRRELELLRGRLLALTGGPQPPAHDALAERTVVEPSAMKQVW